MVTQKDVADRAGVSFITVSRVVNNLGNVKPETRARVEKAIQELKYYPNRQAQALNNGLTHTLALVTPRMFDLPLFNNFYVISLLSGVEMKGRELGWDVLLTTDFDREGDFDFLRVWHQRKVDGLIFLSLRRFPSDQILEIEQQGIPCVSISDRIDSPSVSWVDTENFLAAQDAVRRMVELGHTHLAYLGVDMARDYNPNFRDRELGVKKAAKEFGVKLDVIANHGLDSGGDIAPSLYLAQKQKATGIISGNDSVAMNFISELLQNGLVCGRDYNIIGFDAEPAGRLQNPTLASYRQPLLEMGKSAVKILVDQVTNVRRGKVEAPFSLEYVEGGSMQRVNNS